MKFTLACMLLLAASVAASVQPMSRPEYVMKPWPEERLASDYNPDLTIKPKACDPTLTTNSGQFAPGGQLCHDQMIFNENFDWFNMELWNHENNMNGGGVS